ncbi:MAG: RNA-binding protein [Prevotellaceae bacterium]|jgi:RNA recognition motif-containing protein|nr:RNA-binding protein [Prevotellaceae bacterium]
MNIYVSNLNFSTTGESLQELFSTFGEVTSSKIITDRDTGRSRGFGFVEMPDDSEGQNAISELHESNFEGNTINVNVARPKTEKSSGGYGGGRSSGGYGGRSSGGYGGGRNSGGNSGGYNRNRY